MQITVINLASQPVRWLTTARQLATAGLRAERLPAVCGDDLSRAEIDALYSARLNAEVYHMPLRRGEIGCYASHLEAWQRLVASGASAMAIFEDDIETDADLSEVLQRLSKSTTDWDIVKLIGRAREKVRRQEPLTESRRLISYRRVPSLTGAYVVTAAGARKLLACRQPFGRPVDVDLRHWWECDLDVRGVWPYPVRPAPSGHVSTIGDRRFRALPAARTGKWSYQARYTWANWQASRRVARNIDPPGSEPPAAVADAGALTDRASEGRPGRRNLVVVRAGDASLHLHWLGRQQRDFDIFVSYYGSEPGRWRQAADFYEARPGPKWPCLHELLQQHPELIDRYEAFWFPDDDLLADSTAIDRMFAFCCAYQLCLAQPALTRNSFYTWNTLLQDRRCHIRYTRFVEVMAPVFNRAALRLCAPTFAQSRSGWGLDWLWPRLCDKAGLGRIAIIDATPVQHTRPVGGELYRNHPGMDPRADAERILRRYGIEEVRAVAKYSFEGQVREVSLPLGKRLVYWLKRLNGRRKHRLGAAGSPGRPVEDRAATAGARAPEVVR